jgi:competence protein ComEC
MYLGGTAAMVGLAFLPFGRLLAWAAWLPLTYTVRVVEGLAGWIHTTGATGRVQPAVPLAYYGLLALVTLRPPTLSLQAIRHWLRRKAVRRALVATLIVAAILVWASVFSLPDGKLHVIFLDVGQGDAIWIETPIGRRVLIDGGPSPAALLSALGRQLPFWDRCIDILVVSHPHDDHLRGLVSVLERYRVRQVLIGNMESTSALYEEWQKMLEERKIPVLTVRQPVQVDLGDGPKMEVLLPDMATLDDSEEASLVARLSWGKVSFLITGDLEAAGLLALGRAGWPLDSTVLKVPHHGSKEAVNESLLAVTCPELAVISVGSDNLFGHPAAETLAVLEVAGVQVLRTDQVGTVEVVADGERYWVRTRSSR